MSDILERRNRYFRLNGSDDIGRPPTGKLQGGGKIVKGLHSRTSTEDIINDNDWYKKV